MLLSAKEVELSKPRDEKKDARRLQKEFSRKNAWLSFGEEGRRIHQVLANVKGKGILKVLHGWETYLEKALTFCQSATSQERTWDTVPSYRPTFSYQ